MTKEEKEEVLNKKITLIEDIEGIFQRGRRGYIESIDKEGKLKKVAPRLFIDQKTIKDILDFMEEWKRSLKERCLHDD